MASPVDVQPIEWLGDRVRIIDQTRLPREEVFLEITDYRELAAAIKELKIRGAPAIGVAGAYAVVLGALQIQTASKEEFLKEFQNIAGVVAGTRPTAKNLFWAVERMQRAVRPGDDVARTKKALVQEARRIHAAEAEATFELSRLGADLIADDSTVLTHCNAGPLATAGYGTAVGVIKWAVEKQGKKVRVYADETRPLLQGARLTCWELKKADIPVTLITDSMAGSIMRRGKVSSVVVGADRIAANGDTANKIGTYSVAVLAKENGVPFYVAAPISTFDLSLASGDDIPIEERSPTEVTCIQGICTAPDDIGVANPAFDVTPHRYITAIITEKGIVREPYEETVRALCSGPGNDRRRR